MSKAKSSSVIPEDLKLTHDGYFQETFQTKRLAKAFLRKVLPKETLKCLHLEKLTTEKRDNTDELFKGAIADIVYRVPIKGTKEYVNFFVVMEHKSRQDHLTIF
jgi:predicted transposase YdaD